MNGLFKRRSDRIATALLLPAGALFAAGCVERTLSIQTQPEGARVWLNDDEVGRTPVKVNFTWYGDYDIILRKEGYQTVKTHYVARTPWYQTPGLDLVSECFIPYTVYDEHAVGPIDLQPQQPPDKEVLLNAAEEMRARAE